MQEQIETITSLDLGTSISADVAKEVGGCLASCLPLSCGREILAL